MLKNCFFFQSLINCHSSKTMKFRRLHLFYLVIYLTILKPDWPKNWLKICIFRSENNFNRNAIFCHLTPKFWSFISFFCYSDGEIKTRKMIIIDSQLENDGRVNLAAASLRAQVKNLKRFSSIS